MNGFGKTNRSLLVLSSCWSLVRTGAICLLMMLLVVLCSSCGQASTTDSAGTSFSSETHAVKEYPIKVYFSKLSQTGSDTNVLPVNRVSPTKSVATYAIQLLIAGPTPEEREMGYFSELNGYFTGRSECHGYNDFDGPDFQLELNKKGSISEQGTATVKFCRPVILLGTEAESRVLSQIGATLKQFPTIKKVVVLDKDGHCFGDMSGKQVCLR